tara:strand:+ start:317 stop:823 length:507 start_codon:yes stop_codon:yes gene_type:complete
MNKQNKARFTKLYLEDKLQRYPSFIGREYAVPAPKLKETGANDLTRLVIDFLTLNNCQAERISSQGQYRDNTKQVTDVIGRVRTIGSGTWTKGTSTAGTADISSTIPININGNIVGFSVKWEVKWQKDVQSNFQKEYESTINNSGGKYFIIRTFDEFIEIYDGFIKSF